MSHILGSRPFRPLQILSFAVVCMGAVSPVFAAPDNQGREFVLGFMENYRNDGNPSTINLYLTAPGATSVTVQGPGYGPQIFPVSPDTITRVPDLPLSLRASGSGTIENKGLRLTAPDEFVVYGLNQQKFTTDAYLGLPTDTAGTEYIVPSFSNAKKTLPGELQIIAHEDGTEVTFTPAKATVKGLDVKSIKAGKSAHFTLNRLQSIQFKAKGGYLADLTGSMITSSKPISVFGGHQCGIVPRKSLACDHMVEQIPPVNTWGTSFLTTPLATRKKGDVFRVLAANDGTEVSVDGKRIATLKKRKFKQIDLASGSFHQIKTSGPALVVQYSKGKSVDKVESDPFMMMIPPTEQFGSDYVFSTPSENPVSFKNYINIVAPTGQVGGLRLDGQIIPEADFVMPFTPIGNTGYSGAQVKITTDTHQIKHVLPNVSFGLYSYGFADSDSYGYPGGSRLAKIAETCTPTETEQGDGVDNDCDGKIDEELYNGQDDDGDGKIDEDLAKVGAPVADVGGPYTVNEGSTVVLDGSAASDPNGDELTFEWDLDNDGTFETSGSSPSFAGIDGPSQHTVAMRAAGLGGSNQASTTVSVVNVAPTVNAGADAAVNEGAAFSGSGSFVDPGADTWTATVDYGDGSGVQALSLNGKTFALNHAYADNGVYTVTVTVTDGDGASGSDTVQVTVNNVAPAVNAGADTAINEGAAFIRSGSFADPGADTWTATVDYGDGSGVQALALSGKTFALNHTYADNDVYTVTVTVTDDNGGSGSDTVQVAVNNVAPTITGVSWNNACDQEVVVTYSDPAGVLDEPYALTINWSIFYCTTSTAMAPICSTEDYQQTVSDYASGDPVSLLGYTPPPGTSIINYGPTRVEVSDKDNGSNATTVIPDTCQVPG